MASPPTQLPDGGSSSPAAPFDKARGLLSGEATGALRHGELGEHSKTEGFELLRLLLQDHPDLRASRKQSIDEVLEASGGRHG